MERAKSPADSPVGLILRANRYLATLTGGTGNSQTQVAEHYKTDLSCGSRLLPFAFLSPTIVDAIMTGSQPAELNAHRLRRIADLPCCWKRAGDRYRILKHNRVSMYVTRNHPHSKRLAAQYRQQKRFAENAEKPCSTAGSQPSVCTQSI